MGAWVGGWVQAWARCRTIGWAVVWGNTINQTQQLVQVYTVDPGQAAPTVPECFANQSVYASPSAYIVALIAALPPDQQLTSDQALFMARFAAICDEVWKDEGKPPHQRKVHHILLLGQGSNVAFAGGCRYCRPFESFVVRLMQLD